jgi:hypothetical protein
MERAMKHLALTVLVSLAVTAALLFGAREVRHYFHKPQARMMAAPEKSLAIKPEVNVSIDINVTDILAAAVGGGFVARKMHRRKQLAKEQP